MSRCVAVTDPIFINEVSVGEGHRNVTMMALPSLQRIAEPVFQHRAAFGTCWRIALRYDDLLARLFLLLLVSLLLKQRETLALGLGGFRGFIRLLASLLG